MNEFYKTAYFYTHSNIEDIKSTTKDNCQAKPKDNTLLHYDIKWNNKNEENSINEWTKMRRNAFNNGNHLNKYDVDLIQFYMNTDKPINKGRFSESFLGEYKFTGIKVIILESDFKYEEDIITEKYILNKINGAGKFPPFYDIMYGGELTYLIEGHMGFDLKSLFKICDKHFNLFTTMKIGIYIITNLKILHEIGYFHRDLKPNSLAFGPLCPENKKFKSIIGILDLVMQSFFLKKMEN